MCKICFFFFFFLSIHHDTNPLLHLYHFRKKYNYTLANIYSESSRVIFSFFLSSSIGPSKFCNHLKHSANKKIFMYNLCFGLSKLYTIIQQDQKAKLDYHMSMLFAYMAGGEGGVEVLKCFVRGVRIFLLALCVCVGGGQVQYLSFREKKLTDLPSY